MDLRCGAYQIFRIRELLGKILLFLRLDRAQNMVCLSRSDLAIAEVVIVYCNVIVAGVWSARRNLLRHVTCVLKKRIDEVMLRPRTLLDKTGNIHG